MGYDVLNDYLDTHTDLWYEEEGLTATESGDALVIVGRVQIPSIGLDVFTTISGIRGLKDEVLVGRFLVGDVQAKLYTGPLCDTVSLPINDKV
jgi:hypothetical protein